MAETSREETDDDGGGYEPTPSTVERSPAPIGMVLCKRYRLEAIIGRGASAVIYRGSDEWLEQPVAIKLLLPDGIAADPVASDFLNLRTEAIATMRLSHPNVLRVFNYEQDTDRQFLVMEYVRGEDSRQVRARSPNGCLTAQQVVRIGVECLRGLAHAHGLGVLHNDIKPSNILLTRAGSVKLCDFGLARLSRTPKDWPLGVIAGTPAFMSPERISGEPGDQRSDIYSLAATLYALGNGRTVFGGRGNEAYAAHLFSPVPPSPRLHPAVHEAIVTAMAKKPDDRFASADEMRVVLERALRRIVAAGSSVESNPRRRAADRERERLDALTTVVKDGAGRADPRRTVPPPLPRTKPPAAKSPNPQPRAESAAGAEAASAESIDDTNEWQPEEVQANMVVEARMLPEGGNPANGVGPDGAIDPEAPGMVLVPRCRIASAYSRAVIELYEFWIDIAPVTNRQYLAFVRATDELAPEHWLGGEPPHVQMDDPVVGVSREAALRYAQWCDKRLPTDFEWEVAARYPDARPFPWGSENDSSRYHGPKQEMEQTARIGEYPTGISALGCMDMVGNVWEWTMESGDTDPVEPGYAWVFGGSYRHEGVRNGAIARSSVLAVNSYPYLGFRCVRDK